MIVYPESWKKIGAPISTADIEERLIEVLKEMDCNCLSFSGGVDSSLLLYHMCQMFKKVEIFTMGLSDDHPDVRFAKKVVADYKEKFRGVWLDHKIVYYSQDEKIKDAVFELFYAFVANYSDGIITGDVIDEYTCGYYAHMTNPTEEVYYDHIRQLQKNHLIPLDKNSGGVKIYLPYADEKVIAMLSQIPLKDKVDFRNRKKVIIEMARGKVPDEVILRRKYGFCDALTIKK